MNKIKSLFIWNKTLVTTILVGINLVVYLWMMIRFGTTTEVEPLLKAGANFAPFIIYNQEWYRLITAAFIHIGGTHLLMNMIVLYFLGIEIEPIMGSFRFLILYFVSAIGGNVLSFAFNDNVSAGASTALFGMFTAMLTLSSIYPDNHYLKSRAWSMGFVLAFNIVLGLVNQGVDNFGHIGGALFGALITYAIETPIASNSKRLYRILALVSVFILFGLFVWYGFYSRGFSLGGVL